VFVDAWMDAGRLFHRAGLASLNKLLHICLCTIFWILFHIV